MNRVCPICGVVYGAEVFLCPDDLVELVPYVPPGSSAEAGAPDPGPPPAPARDAPPSAEPVPEGEPWSTAVCWNCGQRSPNPANTECLNPPCRRSLVPPALVIRFEFGDVEVDVGGRTQLGRHGPHSRVFRSYPNVSRRHAIVGVDPDGRAWIEPVPTPNGTFVNDREIPESRPHPLRTRDSVRLALHAVGKINIYLRPPRYDED